MSQTWNEGLFGCFGDCKLCEFIPKIVATNEVCLIIKICFEYEGAFRRHI